MIKYKLICKACTISFDSWFSSSKEYEKLKKFKHLNCHNCHSINVEKTLMAPSVVNSKDKIVSISKDKKTLKIRNKIKEYQKFIKKNFNYVGDNFASEARSIHYNEKKNTKGIYGDATAEELSELKDEGIETEVIPWFNDKEN
tara:strand:- start:34 stop:462 length:429 start_codon:yes stop_codon:yes gene_type:complete